jgi:hypothetical protein
MEEKERHAGKKGKMMTSKSKKKSAKKEKETESDKKRLRELRVAKQEHRRQKDQARKGNRIRRSDLTIKKLRICHTIYSKVAERSE